MAWSDDMAIWQLRAPFFKGANAYKLESSGKTVTLDVDKDGYFSIGQTGFPLGIYAKSADVAFEKPRVRAQAC